MLIMDDRIKNPFIIHTNIFDNGSHFEDITFIEKIKQNEKVVDYIRKVFLLNTKHIFSDSIKDVIENENGYIESRGIFISSKREQLIYWEVKLEQIDCVIDKKIHKAEEIKLQKDKIKEKSIFIIIFNNVEYLIVRFDIAEKIMKTLPLGISFRLIKTI